MIDQDGPEPPAEEVEATRLPPKGFDHDWHSHLVMRLMRAEADPDGVYRGSIKRLALATGLGFQNVQIVLMMLEFNNQIIKTDEGVIMRCNGRALH